MNPSKLFAAALIAGSMFAMPGCSNSTDCTKVVSKRAGNDELICHFLSDPDKLNPLTSSDAQATYVQNNIFMYLLDVDKEKLEIAPALAKERPKVSEVTEGEYAGGMKVEYEIRPEAVWDNGTPVTAYDVVFTYKAIKNPKVDAQQLRPYIDYVNDVVVDKENPKKFTIYSKQKFFDIEYSTGGQAYILPEYAYDPTQIMRKFSFKELNDEKGRKALMEKEDLSVFAQDFNSEKHMREKGSVIGCGPYEFTSWVTTQRIVLTRKKNWWGDKLAGTSPVFAAAPSKITYELVNDWTTAVTAMKDENLDVIYDMQPKMFNDLQKNETFKCKFNTFTPKELSYVYIGMNTKNPKLADLNVRKALAHLVDRSQIISVLLYGNASPVYGPVQPAKKYCDTTLAKYEHNLEKAKKLLDDAGWKDSDGDGIRDKMIDGQKVQLSISYKYNSGNDTREKIGLFLKDNAQKAGIKIEMIVKEWTVFLNETKHHDFELYCGGWVSDPISDDPKQIWHTESYNNGSNYVGFGDQETDATIDSLRTSLDPAKIDHFYHQFQQQVNQRVPYIFLYSPNNRLAIAKRFTNGKGYVARPGYSDHELSIGKGATPK